MKEEGNKKMRGIDADKLFEEIKRNDLEFMQQANLMICLKNIIDRQPTISKTIGIPNICDYCEREKYIIKIDNRDYYNPDSLTVGIIGNKLLATTENLVGEQDINYCPICGKKLDS
ncbi:hypothetical protein FDF97_15290 [Clostridium botulinum]|uniref:Uncharacterized protein n=2 Tax=Clostridium botulinum TaxID=1491 RepID=A0AA43YAY6_CLOBO|nr:hypothetical protein [Clostridium botulinum]NFI09755.1 hypothetical protein [Clostridium botulinum]NFI23413.1 hypothetical protein [Clostridium botulinum]NFQ79561.1 hypothetical protein [Clostridium botulinum]